MKLDKFDMVVAMELLQNLLVLPISKEQADRAIEILMENLREGRVPWETDA